MNSNTTKPLSRRDVHRRYDAGSYFGIAPQVGVNLGAVRLAAMYNLLFGGNTVSVTTGSQESISPSFLGIELSFRLGGGRRDGR